MAFANGVFSRLYSWVTDRDGGIKVRADRMDAEMDGIKDALNEITAGTVQMIGSIKGYDGTVSAPGYGFNADTNTGLYRIGTDNLGVALAGVKHMDLSTTGIALLEKGAPTSSGTDTITLTWPIVASALASEQRIVFKAGGTNTGAATLNLNSLGAKAVRKISGGTDVALSAGDITAGNYYTAIYDASANSAAGAWVLSGSASVAAATTSAAGIVELATLAETLAYTDSSRAVTPSNLPLPTGFVYGLTLSTNVSDATNDIDIAAGSARDASDSYNYLRTSTLVKQTDAAWALGTNAGSLDTGSIGNNRYAIWGIGRSDTRVCDVLTSLSFSSPTMPTNYDFKVLLGEFTRAGGVNGTPLWYGPRDASTGYSGITLAQPVAATSGTSIDFTGIPPWAKRITLSCLGVSLNGASEMMIQIGDSGGIETSGYGGAVGFAGVSDGATQFSTGFVLTVDQSASDLTSGTAFLVLANSATNTWAHSGNFAFETQAYNSCGGGRKSLSAVLDRVRITSVNGTDTFDAGTINISYE